MNASTTRVLIIAEMVCVGFKPDGMIGIIEADQFVGVSQGKTTTKEPP
jgi:hypothetical protein